MPMGFLVCVKSEFYGVVCVRTWLHFVVEGGGGGGVSTIKITWADTRAAQRRRPGCPVPLLLLLLCRGSNSSSSSSSSSSSGFVLLILVA